MRRRIARVFDVSLMEVDRWFNKRSVAPSGLGVPAWLGTFAALEQGASELCAFEPMVVPGLLQTANYAAALQRGEIVPRTEDEVGLFVEHRLARQDVLVREPDPLKLSVVFDESVLHRPIGNRSVMAAQLAHLIEMADRRNIDIRVLPLDAGVLVAAFGSFTVLTSPESPEPYMAVVFDRAGAHYLDRTHEIEAHVRLFDHLKRVALSPSDSVDLVRTVNKERYL